MTTRIDEVITIYLSAIVTEGKSPHTIRSYRNSLADFRRVSRTLGLPDELDAIEVSHVYAYLADIRARKGRGATGGGGTSPAYQNHHHRTLKAFFTWCQRMDYLDPERTHVFARVPLSRVEKKVGRPFSDEQVEQLLAGCDRTDWFGCRNFAMVLFLLDSGMRARECTWLRQISDHGPSASVVLTSDRRRIARDLPPLWFRRN